MFYDKFLELCNQKIKSPSVVADELGFARSSITKWKSGATLRPANLKRVADYFGVPVSYFSDEFREAKKASALNEKVEAIMKVYDMLTPENKERFSDSLSEILSALIKEQLQG